MILVDTSVWIDHLHATEPDLVAELESGAVAQHPMIVGELALGSLTNRRAVISLLADLPRVQVADEREVMHLVESRQLYARGLSLVDAHLLASVRLTGDAALSTRDRRLSAQAQGLGIVIVDR